jgi:hypothetical protein
VPRWIADLLVQLQAAAGEELVVPGDTIAAHGQLLDLRHNFMPQSSPPEASDPELERRLCATCAQPMSPLSKQSDCTNCRRCRGWSAVPRSRWRQSAGGHLERRIS